MADNLREQKSKKKQSIMSAAYNCFIEKGIHKASVDEIVKNANVAKGTFYLYFKDKADLMQQISINVSKRILIDAYIHVKQNKKDNDVDNIIALVDYIIEYFKAHKLVLKLIERNFSWPLVESEINKEQDDIIMVEMLNTLFDDICPENFSKDKIFKYLFSIIALVGSVGYSSIIYEQPDTIDNMKPVLYEMIVRLLN